MAFCDLLHTLHKQFTDLSQQICVLLLQRIVRDWSLITGKGGYKTGGGGAREVLPLRKGWAEKVLAMLKGGHKKF